MKSAYRTALARVHDDGFGFIAEGSAKLLIEGLKLNGFGAGTVAELACGGGISSRIIVDAGYDVYGCDISPAMIEIARRRVPEADLTVCSLYDAELPADCVAVTAIGEAFNYRFDERAGIEAVTEVFARVHDALTPGGIFLLDVAQPTPMTPRLEHMVWEGEGWRATSECVEGTADATLERRITIRTGSRLEEEDVEIHRLALYDHEEVFGILRDCGFDVATLAAYGSGYRFSAAHGGFYAVRR